MIRSHLSAAIIAEIMRKMGNRTNEPAGPARFRNVCPAYRGPSKRDERVCKAICEKGADGTTEHRTSCRVGIAEFNQFVSNRQVRRAYARIMAKRGES